MIGLIDGIKRPGLLLCDSVIRSISLTKACNFLRPMVLVLLISQVLERGYLADYTYTDLFTGALVDFVVLFRGFFGLSSETVCAAAS